MKILTKEWVKQYEQVRLIRSLKEFDDKSYTYEQIKKQSVENFNSQILEDVELSKLAFSSNLAKSLYDAQIERNEKTLMSLPQSVLNKIEDFKFEVLGFLNKKNKIILLNYANKAYIEIENKAKAASKIIAQSQELLSQQIDFDYIVGELVFEEYESNNNYYINVDDRIICIENYQIIERENYKINKWDYDNPVSEWTNLEALELYVTSDNRFELCLLLVNGDKLENKTYWNFTLKGTNVKLI